MDKTEKILVKILRAGAALVFFIPLVYSSATIFPFIFPKSLAFRVLIELLAAPYLYLILTRPAYRPARSGILKAIGIFFIIEVLATVFGADPLRSFWGNHERMMGLYMYAHVLVFMLIAVSVYRTKEEWKQLLFYAIVAGAVITGIGYIQFFSSSFLHETRGGRIFSTFGNSIYLAAYLLFAMHLVLWRALEEKRRHIKMALFVLLGLELIAFFWAHTRGATIALAVSLASLATIAVYRRFKSRRGVFWAAAATPVILVLVFVLLGKSGLTRNIKIFSVFSQLNFREITAQTRLLNWQVGLRAWASRPILGWGPENYYFGFNKFYAPKFFKYSAYETWQDHSHNFLIDKLSDSGAAGLIAFLAIFVFAGKEFARLLKKDDEWLTGAVFLSALAAYFVQNVFAFDTLGIWLMIYSFFGYAHISSAQAVKKEGEPAMPRFLRLEPAVRFTATLGIFAVSFVAALLTNVIPFRVSAQTIRAGGAFETNPQAAYELLAAVLEQISPYKAESRDELAKLVTVMLQRTPNLTRDNAARLVLRVRDEYEKNLASHPNDTYFNLNMAQWYMLMGSILDPSYFLDAEERLLKAKELSPRRQQVYFSLMRLYILRGRLAEAAALGREAVELESRVPKSHWHYGEALARSGDEAGGYKEMRGALRHDFGTPYNAWTPPEMDFYLNLAKKNNDETEVFWWTGINEYQAGNFKSAFVNMKKAADSGYTPATYDHLKQYLSAAESAGDPIKDLAIIERFNQYLGVAPEIEFEKAKILINRGERDRAREILIPLQKTYLSMEPQISALLDKLR